MADEQNACPLSFCAETSGLSDIVPFGVIGNSRSLRFFNASSGGFYFVP